MSTHQSRDAPADPPDEESQSLLVGDNNAPERAPRAAARVFSTRSSQPPPSVVSQRTAAPSPTISAFDAMAQASNTRNPVMLVKMVARKFILLLTTAEEESDPSNGMVGYSIGLLKDIILGVVFGVLTISFAVVLDHRNVIHFQSAHHLRDAAYAAMSDPQTITLIEAETDMKFMSVADYDASKKEIDDSLSNLESIQKKLEGRTKELEEKQKELATVNEEKKKLMENPKVQEIDNWCGSCQWANTSCDARVSYLGSTYNLAKLPAMLGLIKEGKCKK